MALEGLAILVLGLWLYVEYTYNSGFRSSLNEIVFTRATEWTSVLGLSAGLVGSIVALGVWRSLRQMRYKVETLERDLMEASKRSLEKPPSPVLPAASSPVESEGRPVTVQPQATSLAIIPAKASTS